jgi:hypothetical protein
MDSVWLRQLQVQVNKRKRTFEVPGYRQSRRVEGLFNRDDEVSGFKHLCIYVDAGLIGKEQQIAKILGVVDGKIYGYEHHDHTRWPMFFGIESDKLTTLGPVRVHHGIRSCDWEKIVKQHLLPIDPSSPIIIPRLRNSEVARTRTPDRYDLGLFFCRNRDVFVQSEEEQTFFRQIGSRCIWIFIGEEETPQMETGMFVPQLALQLV